MATAAEIAELYEELNFPSATVFHKALRRRGIPARLKDIEEFVASRSERQVIAPGPKFTGNIVSFDVNHRWAADLIAFTSRPAKSNDGTYTHVLIVQDLFSRFLWVRPLQSTSDATTAFENIMITFHPDAGPYPQRLDTDGGPEFANKAFRDLMLRYKIEHVIKDPKDYQALAITDRAIGIVKRMLKRRQEAKGGSWLNNLDATIRAYNNSDHGGIGTEPSQLTDDHIFSLKKEAAEDLVENTKIIQKRQEKLESAGAYRTHEPKDKLVGLKRRIDANTWSRQPHQVKSFPAPGIVEDTEGNKTLTKLTRPMPRDSSRMAAQQEPPPPDNMEPFATHLRNTLPARGQSFGQAAKELKRRPGFTDALKASRMSFREFVLKFPRHVRVHEGRLYGLAQTTL